MNNWILIAKRPDGDLETIKKVIQKNQWDFVSSKDTNRSVTPSYALELKKGDNVLFYLSTKDQNGNVLSPYPYPIFFAHAILDSKFKIGVYEWGSEKKYIRLKNIRFFEPIEVKEPRNNYKIGYGPAMIVPIYKKKQYENICKQAGID